MTSPSFAQLFRLGQSALQAGRWAAAAEAFSQAAVLRPDVAPLHALLGVALLHGQRLEEAERSLRAALSLDASEVSARSYLGVLLNVTGRHQEALSLLGPLAQERPSDMMVLSEQATALRALGRRLPAAQVIDRLAHQRGRPEDWLQASVAWLEANAPRPAELALRRALQLAPAHPVVLARLGLLLLDRGQQEEAETHLQAALRQQPTSEPALVGLARLCLRRRQLVEAQRLLAPLIAGGAGAEAVALWAELQRRLGTPAVALPHLETALARAPSPTAQGLLQHHLGHTLDALGAHDAAFDAWLAARAAQHQRFNPQRHRRAVAALRQGYAPAHRQATAQNRSSLPVFIVGMPRSGTSLLEQMLDSHPQLQGIGEREEVRLIAAALSQHLCPDGAPYYVALDRLTPALLDRHADAHLSALRALAQPGVSGIIDKMPHNFLHLGLIGQLFPKARVIHCVRDPVDTCFSCFRQRFGAGLSYTTRLDWLGHFYRAYAALMAHWQTALPLPIHEVRYESLVQAPEQTLRETLHFLGLPWDPGCLSFHTNTRDVGTASHGQVQQPLYASSIGRSAPYRHRLQPLLQALQGDTDNHARRDHL